MRRGLFKGLVAALALTEGVQAGTFESGRGLEGDRNTRFEGIAGSIVELDGYVQETTRAFYDASGQSQKQQDAERYDLSDFEIDDGYMVIGFGYEQAWKYVTFQARALGMNPETSAVARRNYYIDVDEVSFNGRDYENMKIPEGTSFSAEMMTAYIGLDLVWTPFHLHFTENTRFSPWIGIGAVGLVGTYDIDAGPARGVVQYQNPPEEFVVGGSAEGNIGGGLPEFVVGGEYTFGEEEGYMRASLFAQAGFLNYEGDISYFTSSSRGYDKDADIDHLHVRVGAELDIPLEAGPVVTMGLSYESMETEAELRQQGGSTEEILARRERFDKNVDFSMSMITGYLGVAF